MATESAPDYHAVEKASRDLVVALGITSEELIQETPSRMARMFCEMLHGGDPSLPLERRFAETHDELVLVKDIQFASMCEHHILPYVGRAHVAYIPDGKITGLSKLARCVRIAAARPSLQERVTSMIADVIDKMLAPKGVMVVLEAEHLCMVVRGVHSPGAKTITSAVRGVFLEKDAARAELLALVGVGNGG